MKDIKRLLNIDLPERQSAFLWGPRKTGKSTWLRKKFPASITYDFLQTDLYMRFAKEPYLLRQELLAMDQTKLVHPVVLDEVQKIPPILDEVHWLIENKGLRFILCGSSARKLKRGQANLLGGRAWRFEMMPLTWKELGDNGLLQMLNRGLLPPHYFSERADLSLKAYVQDYLQEEIKAEGLVRNMPSFARFLDSLGYSHGEMTNFSNIARECGVDAKTVRGYYDILVDTMLGGFVPPYTRKKSRQLITSVEKFYLCDVGVAGFLSKRILQEERGDQFGKAFEHFILMELWAYRAYTGKSFEIRYWRTKAGYEVDYILGDGEIAIEVKGTANVEGRALRPLRAFAEEYKPERALLVCNEQRPRQIGAITILPWSMFFDQLWAGEIVK